MTTPLIRYFVAFVAGWGVAAYLYIQ